MIILEEVKNNFLGASHDDQKRIIEFLENSISDEELRSNFDGVFYLYHKKIENLILFRENYKSFDKNQKIFISKISINELLITLQHHNINNSEENRMREFAYHASTSFYELIDEIRRYFKPKKITNELLKQFIQKFSDLNEFEKNTFIKEFCLKYNRLSFFNLPVSNDMLSEYKPVVKDILGEDIIKYYDALYPEEQFNLILNVCQNKKIYSNVDEKEIEECKYEIVKTLKKQLFDEYKDF